MGVYIKGMEMPKSCYMCDFCADFVQEDGIETLGCRRLKRAVPFRAGFKFDDCPLVLVPPHRRLGDLDALHKLFLEKGKKYKGVGGAMVAAAAWCIANAPTIIEAEEGE